MLRRIFPGIYEGWLVVGSAAVTTLLIGASFFYGFGTIFNEVKDEFGWTTAMTRPLATERAAFSTAAISIGWWP